MHYYYYYYRLTGKKKTKNDSIDSREYCSWGWFEQFWVFLLNWPQRAYQMTRLYELYPHCSSGQEWIWLLPCLSLSLKEELTCLTENSQSPTAKPQHWHESMCTVACFSSFPHVSAQCPDTCRRSSCCFLTFSQRPALHHRICVIYTHSCKSIFLCIVAYVRVQAWGD